MPNAAIRYPHESHPPHPSQAAQASPAYRLGTAAAHDRAAGSAPGATVDPGLCPGRLRQKHPDQQLAGDPGLPPSSRGLGRRPFKPKTGVRISVGAPTKIHPELRTLEVEQFLAMLRFEQRDKLAELPIDLNRSGRDGFLFILLTFLNNHIQVYSSIGT